MIFKLWITAALICGTLGLVLACPLWQSNRLEDIGWTLVFGALLNAIPMCVIAILGTVWSIER